MLKFWRAILPEITCSTVRTRAAVMRPSTEWNSRSTAARRPLGSTAVRTAQESGITRLASAVIPSGTWLCGRYITPSSAASGAAARYEVGVVGLCGGVVLTGLAVRLIATYFPTTYRFEAGSYLAVV